MSFWKPLIDWNASHKYHAVNRSEAKLGIGVGIWKAAPGQFDSGGTAAPVTAAIAPPPAAPPYAPYTAPGDIHGAF